MKIGPRVVAGGAIAFAAGAFAFSSSPRLGGSQPRGTASAPLLPPEASAITDDYRRQRFADLSPEYDAIVGKEEQANGILKLRTELVARYARGRVLEIAAGTGRNLDSLLMCVKHGQCTSLCLTDASKEMLAVLRRKLVEIAPAGSALPAIHSAVFDVEGPEAEARLSQQPVDTVLQTFALCSFADPQTALLRMSQLVDKQDHPAGRILLLEHGRVHSGVLEPLLNWYLDRTARRHASVFGCWYNRPVYDIVSSFCVRHGWRIAAEGAIHLGTTMWFVLEPAQGPPTSG